MTFSVALNKDLQNFTIVSPASAVPAGYHLAVGKPTGIAMSIETSDRPGIPGIC